MNEETVESINKSTDIDHLSVVEQRTKFNISLLENKKTLNDNFSIKNRLIQEANKYGVATLDEYIAFKLKFYHSLNEACINRLILLNSDTSSRSSASPVTV
jgi:hypothetical protein